ncbi:hypothetical protein [Tenacibaculum halocynthiae]|uniref:hypothetical protein n=1 Tax=Tenacibaculum halocynthiae TaxID=1254437 RepID=UPI003894FBB0
MSKDNYNQIFENLVEEDSNLIGLIAYGLYKSEKRKEIVKIKKSGKRLTKSQINGIESVLSNQLETFKEKANDLLDRTFEILIEENKDRIYSEYFLVTHLEGINSEIQKLNKKQTFLDGLSLSIAYRFIWVLLISLVGSLAYYNSESLKEIGEKINKTIFTDKNTIDNTQLQNIDKKDDLKKSSKAVLK